MSGSCFVAWLFVSFNLAEEESAGCFILIVLWLSSFCVSDVGWSAVCDCGISWPYSLTYWHELGRGVGHRFVTKI